jgi:glycosyltransferase involved in cell wall biosynthesis
MKILYLHQYFKFPNEPGGTRSFDLANGFVELGHDVEMITSTSDEKYKTENRWVKLEQKGLVVHYIYLPYGNHLPYFQRSMVFFQFLWFSTVKLLSLRGDVVLATSTPLTIGVPALLKKWFHNTPFIFEARDVWPEAVIAIGALKNKILQKLLYSLEQLIYKKASAIVPLSVDMKYSIVKRYTKLTSKPIEVIENISEINRFQNGYLKEVSVLTKKIGTSPRFPILYAGTFGRVNGIAFVVALAEKLILLDPSIVFVLIGEGAEKNAIIQLAKDKGVLNKNIFILDSVSKQDLPQLYYECSMGSSFVIPIKELWANSANKFFDTLASAKPILINHKGWQKEVIEKENIGYVLPDAVSDESAAAFVLYTRNEILITDQKVNALNVAKEKYALEVAVLKYIKILKDLNISCKK